MREILPGLVAALDRGRRVAWCRLVETRGSTPQKAGAAMLVFEDGSQAGTLGGGCVEAEVKRKALQTLADGAAAIVCFQLDNDYGWDDGLICGGRMQVLIDPLRDTESQAYFRKLASHVGAGLACQEAISFDAEKSGVAETASFLVDEHGELLASVRGSDALLPHLRERMPDLRERPRPQAAGGLAFLPMLERCRLVIVGAGHVGKAVAAMAADLDFDVCVVDDRTEFVTPERFPTACERLSGPMDEILPAVQVTPNTYCLIVTRGHNHDEQALFHLCRRGARYVGMIGSKRKIKLIFDDLLREGIPQDVLQAVYAPVGIDIGSQSVPEIAVSIVAELIAHRNLGGEVPGRESFDLTEAACPTPHGTS